MFGTGNIKGGYSGGLRRSSNDGKGFEGDGKNSEGRLSGSPQRSSDDPGSQVAGGARGNGAQGGPQAAAALAPLHIAENAPPKNKPVTLVYGGGFNRTHEGHSTALLDSYNQLTKAGYTVDRVVVAPTSDRLLAGKVDPIDHLSLRPCEGGACPDAERDQRRSCRNGDALLRGRPSPYSEQIR